jgi:hypothetical protein
VSQKSDPVSQRVTVLAVSLLQVTVSLLQVTVSLLQVTVSLLQVTVTAAPSYSESRGMSIPPAFCAPPCSILGELTAQIERIDMGEASGLSSAERGGARVCGGGAAAAQGVAVGRWGWYRWKEENRAVRMV